jgi:hypothetical protein
MTMASQWFASASFIVDLRGTAGADIPDLENAPGREPR